MPSSERRTRLLEEALRLVTDSGLGAVTHRNVEQAADAPHGSVTYWFGSREGLISALVDWMCDESERQVRAIATPVQQQIAAGQTLDVDAIAHALSAWMDGAAPHHLARMELELQGAREPAHAERMTKAAQVFWDMCAAIAEGLGSEDPGPRRPRDGGDARRDPAGPPRAPAPGSRGGDRRGPLAAHRPGVGDRRLAAGTGDP